MLDRRTFLGGVAVAAAAAAAGGAARVLGAPVALGARKGQSAPAPSPSLSTPASPASGSVLGDVDVRAGSRFGRCTVQSVAATEDGAVAVHMRDTGGRLFELELLAHDERAPGVAQAGTLGVYVRNNGTGDKATNEEHGLAAMAFAGHLRRRQAAGARMPLPPTLARRTGRTRASSRT
jgi:hypothetical protein